jgi:hypothetical protein
MAWVIWHDDDDKGRRVYVRRITPNFTSFTVEPRDARKYATRAEARAALKGTGLTTYRAGKAPEDDDRTGEDRDRTFQGDP